MKLFQLALCAWLLARTMYRVQQAATLAERFQVCVCLSFLVVPRTVGMGAHASSSPQSRVTHRRRQYISTSGSIASDARKKSFFDRCARWRN